MSPTHFAPWSPTDRHAEALRRPQGPGTSSAGAGLRRIARAGRRGRQAGPEAAVEVAPASKRPPQDEGRTSSPRPSRPSPAGSPVSFYRDVDVLARWWVYRMVRTRVPLREKLTLFWHGHFATGFEKVDDSHLMARQLDTIRRLAWGDFRDLVLAIARDPAMIAYLDGETNTKAHPNENFGRELMELFTCGIGHYTEADVKEAARAFTSWHRGSSRGSPSRPDDHDAGRKRFLGKAGRFDGGDVIDLLIQHPATPRADRHQAPPLLRLPPSLPPEVIEEAAAALRDGPGSTSRVVPPRAVPVELFPLPRPGTGPGSAARPSSRSGPSGRWASAGPGPATSPSRSKGMGQSLLRSRRREGLGRRNLVDQLQHPRAARTAFATAPDLATLATATIPCAADARRIKSDRHDRDRAGRRGRRPPGRRPPPERALARPGRRREMARVP